MNFGGLILLSYMDSVYPGNYFEFWSKVRITL